MAGDSYFQRFGYCARQIPLPPSRDLGLVVVIPCHREPELLQALESIWACERPRCDAEILVVVNSAEGSAPEVLTQNATTIRTVSQWSGSHPDPHLALHVLQFDSLPRKHAGVGLARKIGLDEGAARLDEVGRGREGILACFDADCQCDRDYLVCLEDHFRRHPETPGCSIYFEHPLLGDVTPANLEAIILYELHLRYYVQSLRHVGFPHAYHTVGSAMAFRAGAYRDQGGMNRRQAGEDFYFLQKIIALGGFTDLTCTRVLPSARPSDRVPFGTGRAVRDILERGKWETYPLEAFLDLSVLWGGLPALYEGGFPGAANVEERLPEALRSFLDAEHFGLAIDEIRGNTASWEAFRKRFFAWFNGFRVMKYVHHARDGFYGPRAVELAAKELLARLSGRPALQQHSTAHDLLLHFRQLDRQGGPLSAGLAQVPRATTPGSRSV